MALAAVAWAMIGSIGRAGDDAAAQWAGRTLGEIEAIYRGAAAGPQPCGRFDGTLLTGRNQAVRPWMSRGGRLIWQGKVVEADGAMTNRFFRLPMIPARMEPGTSWLDGQPAWILDYESTSRLYRPYRDELRAIGPGTYLGLMYDRRNSPPRLVRTFLIERR
jgi:hypothetical protein